MFKVKLANKTVLTLLLFVCAVAIMASSFSPVPNDNTVPYPEGYRGWMHVKTAIIEKGGPGFEHWGGFHHIYANTQAVEGYKSGKFPEGSVLVFDVLDAVEQNNVVAEGNRKFIDVMVRDTKRFDSTGGWGYEEFNGDSKTERNIQSLAAASCYSCHAQQKMNDNVFSKIRN